MPKTILIDPAVVRRRTAVSLPDIPVNVYEPDPAAEAARYGPATLRAVYRDMALIRAFESMLDRVKKEGVYAGIEYAHKGPAHLSIGQEAAAVGQALALAAEDLIFGSHRSHGEIVAKSLRAIRLLDEDALRGIMESYLDGDPLRVVAGLGRATVRETAVDYVLYGVLAEIFGRATGFNRGLGGSMHCFFPPFGVMPNNAIVGGSAPIATGAALFQRVHGRPGVSVANIGDAALGSGPVWEAMIFAAMDQFRTLWGPERRGGLPILFNFMNNFYGMGGQTLGETMGFGVLARAGAGVNPAAMHAERVDGFNPLAVADATARQRAWLLAGDGPALLDTVTYRFSGHSPSDASSYRDRDELERWRAADPLPAYGAYLVENGHATADELAAMQAEVEALLPPILRLAADLDRSPRLEPATGAIARVMFGGARPALELGAPDVLIPIEESRLRVTAAKSRVGVIDGRRLSSLEAVTYGEALFEAIVGRFYEDASLIAYGEENRDWGGAFGVYRGLTECLPYHRLFNAPISEAAIVGTAVGYALSGGRALVELMYSDFMGRAGDELFNQLAKWQAMSAGVLAMPVVVRVSVGMRYGAQHSQDWSALVAHIPGLQVMFPATPYDAKGMLTAALRGTDPVIFFESQRLYQQPEIVVPGGVPVADYEVTSGEPIVRRPGSDLTIITLGAALYRALAAADILVARYGLSAEVIDARYLNPLNYEPLADSVRRTNNVLLVSDACERGSFMHTMAGNLTQLVFDYLDAPPVVLGARNWITPPAELEADFFPQADWIVDAVHERIVPLPGHRPATPQGTAEIVARNRAGV